MSAVCVVGLARALDVGGAVELPAGREQLGPRRAMDGAIHPAPAEQRRIGRVHDRLHVELGDVTAANHDATGHVPSHAGKLVCEAEILKGNGAGASPRVSWYAARMEICILGATGLVGAELLELIERAWP